jgi:hypothetical protein
MKRKLGHAGARHEVMLPSEYKRLAQGWPNLP